MATITFRPGTAADHNFVRNAFVRTMVGTAYCTGTPPEILRDNLDVLLSHPAWSLVVACSPDDPDEILGLLLYRPGDRPQVGYIHVKSCYRRKGVAKALLQHATITTGEVDCAFVDPRVAKWCSARGLVLRFRPYLVDVAQRDLFDLALTSADNAAG